MIVLGSSFNVLFKIVLPYINIPGNLDLNWCEEKKFHVIVWMLYPCFLSFLLSVFFVLTLFCRCSTFLYFLVSCFISLLVFYTFHFTPPSFVFFLPFLYCRGVEIMSSAAYVLLLLRCVSSPPVFYFILSLFPFILLCVLSSFLLLFCSFFLSFLSVLFLHGKITYK